MPVYTSLSSAPFWSPQKMRLKMINFQKVGFTVLLYIFAKTLTSSL